MKEFLKWLQYRLLIVLAGILTIGPAILCKFRPLTDMEQAMITGFGLCLGLWGSDLLGKESAQDAAKEMIRPHVSSAFRRVLGLYKSLSRLAQTIASAQESRGQVSALVLEKLEAIVIEQINLADDALEDWRDILPKEVEELQHRMKGKIGES